MGYVSFREGNHYRDPYETTSITTLGQHLQQVDLKTSLEEAFEAWKLRFSEPGSHGRHEVKGHPVVLFFFFNGRKCMYDIIYI